MIEKKINNLTILISTCDSFSDLWDNNLLLLNKYWPNHPDAVYFTDKVSNKKFEVFSCGEGIEFSDRLNKALENVKTEYILLTLDDYLINKQIDDEAILKIIDFMKENNADYYRFFKRTTVKGKFIWTYKTKKLPLTKKAYEVNLYPSIWKTSSLKAIIHRNENIWKFEVRMTRRSRENGFCCFASYNPSFFSFVDTVRKGKYLRKAYKFLKNENLYTGDRKIMTIRETMYLNVRTFISRHFPKCLVKFFKKMSKKKYYSDYANTDD